MGWDGSVCVCVAMVVARRGAAICFSGGQGCKKKTIKNALS